jgi:hypothetical protein
LRHIDAAPQRLELLTAGLQKVSAQLEAQTRLIENDQSQDAQPNRLMRNSSSETIAPRNRSLVIDRHADQFG